MSWSQNSLGKTTKADVKSISLYNVTIKDKRKKVVKKETVYLVEYYKKYHGGNLVKWFNPNNSKSELTSVIDSEKRYFLHPPRTIGDHYVLLELNFFPQFLKVEQACLNSCSWENLVPKAYLKNHLKEFVEKNPDGIPLKYHYFIDIEKHTKLRNNSVFYSVCAEPTKESHLKSGDFRGIYTPKFGFSTMNFFHFDNSEINFELKSKFTVEEFQLVYKDLKYNPISLEDIITILK